MEIKGQDIMALERFWEKTKYMIVFDVLSDLSPVGEQGERIRLFLTDDGYKEAIESQNRAEIRILNQATVFKGDIFYERPQKQDKPQSYYDDGYPKAGYQEDAEDEDENER